MSISVDSFLRVFRDTIARTAELLFRPTLILGLLLLSTGLAILAPQGQLLSILFLVVGVGSIIIFLRWPVAGLIATALAGLVVPFTGPGGITITTILVALVIGLWLLDMVARQRLIRLAASRAVWPALAMVAIALLAFTVGQLPWFSFAQHAPITAQVGGLSIFVFSAGIFLVVAHQIRDLGGLRKLTWAFVAVATLVVAFRLVLPELGLPTAGLFQTEGSVFYIWLIALALSQAAFNGDLRPGWRLALAALVLVTLCMLIIFKYADKSGWIPILACIAAMIAFRSWRVGLLLVPVTALAIYFLSPSLIGTDEYSIATRLDAWSIMTQIIKVSPIWGLGFGNYYWYTPLFPIRGYAVSFNSHNNYIDIVAQTGVVGLICYLWFLFELGWLSWRLRDHVPSGFARAFVYGALGGLVGTAVAGMFGDWVLPFVYNIGLFGFRSSVLAWLFLGGLVSLEQMKWSTSHSG